MSFISWRNEIKIYKNWQRFHEPLPESRIDEIIKECNGDFHARKVFAKPLFHALELFHIHDQEGMRNLHSYLDSPLFATFGADIDCSLGGLSEASKRKPLEPFFVILDELITKLADLGKEDKVIRDFSSPYLREISDLLNDVKILDCTNWNLSSTLASWAKYTENEKYPQAGLRLGLCLSVGTGGVERLIVGTPKEHDSKFFKDLLDFSTSGKIYLFDTALHENAYYDKIVDSHNHFVTLRHKNNQYLVICKNPLPTSPLESGYEIQEDLTIRLGTEKNGYTKNVYHLLIVTNPDGRDEEILTSLFSVSAEIICLLKRYRWTIEVLFRQLKYTLKLKRFWCQNPNGILIQLCVVISLYILLILYRARYHKDASLIAVKRQLRNEIYLDFCDIIAAASLSMLSIFTMNLIFSSTSSVVCSTNFLA